MTYETETQRCTHLKMRTPSWAHEVLFSDAFFSNGIGANFFSKHFITPTRSKFRHKGLSQISLLHTSADLFNKT